MAIFYCDQPAAAPFNWYERVWNDMDYPDGYKIKTSDKVPGYRVYAEFIPLMKLAEKETMQQEIAAYRQRASAAFNCVI